MEQISYPKIEEHKRAHAKLDEKVKSYVASFEQGPKRFNAPEFMEFLAEWLSGHIMSVDMELFEFQRANS